MSKFLYSWKRYGKGNLCEKPIKRFLNTCGHWKLVKIKQTLAVKNDEVLPPLSCKQFFMCSLACSFDELHATNKGREHVQWSVNEVKHSERCLVVGVLKLFLSAHTGAIKSQCTKKYPSQGNPQHPCIPQLWEWIELISLFIQRQNSVLWNRFDCISMFCDIEPSSSTLD